MMSEAGSVSLILFTILHAVPVALTVLLLLRLRETPSVGLRLGVVAASVLALVVNFPTAVPRFWAAAVLIGVSTLMWPRLRKYLVLGIIVGLFLAFPALGGARNADTVSEAWTEIRTNYTLEDAQVTGDFDAYAMVAYSLRHDEYFGPTAGDQLVSSALFFVPAECLGGQVDRVWQPGRAQARTDLRQRLVSFGGRGHRELRVVGSPTVRGSGGPGRVGSRSAISPETDATLRGRVPVPARLLLLHASRRPPVQPGLLYWIRGDHPGRGSTSYIASPVER